MNGSPVVSFASTQSVHYQNMLRIIREARHEALAAPRIDMPGAQAVPGACRLFVPPPLPDAPPKLTAEPDRDGLVHLAWEQSAWTIGLEAELHRHAQADFTPGEETLLARMPRASWIDRDAPEGPQYYALVLVSEDERSRPSYARVDVPAPMPPPAPSALEATSKIVREPVFTARFGENPAGLLHGGSPLAGVRHGAAKGAEAVLDVRGGGMVTFPRHDVFDLTQPLSVSCWVWFDEQGNMPVVVGYGRWNQSGWFLQWLGDRWRWHAGGVDCDGGSPEAGRWMHVAGTFDGHTLRLFQDGTLVAERAGPVSPAPWQGALHVGQYSGGPAPQYQVHGRIANLTVYHRPLPPAEIAELAKTGPE